MGEVGMEVDVEVGTAEDRKKEEEKDGSEVVQWESFLPRMVLRVLLVEADDSTRQIIAALLRKCSYKVAAVPDGLMAWETLKERPHSIDLILTEVELPSISGFALLTLVMEHEICKNIPVIMMSSHDSINMVLKCMLKGAADFLIKPVRRNELRNLWQHVWRRHMLAGGRIPHNLPEAEHKVEATAENNAESTQSSDYGSQKDKERSDTQSSCTTPYLEAESTCLQNMQGLSQLKCTSLNLSDTCGEQQGNFVKLGNEALQNEFQTEAGISDKQFVSENSNRSGKEAACCSEACESDPSKLEDNPISVECMTHNGAVGLKSDRGNVNVMIRVGCNDELVENATGAIDLIGSFDNKPKGAYAVSSFRDGANKFEFSPQLELSLRRSCSSSAKNQSTGEKPTLNHSNASAFSWYSNSKSLQPIFSTLSGCQTLKEGNTKSGQQLERKNGTSKPHVVTWSDSREDLPSPVTGQSELSLPSTQLELISVPGTRLDDVPAQIYYAQSDLPHAWRSKPAGKPEYSPFPVSISEQSDPDVLDSEQGYRRSDEATNCSVDQNVGEPNKLESFGELRCSSPIADQSACSSLCNGVAKHENSSAHGGVSSRSDASASAMFATAVDKNTTFHDSNVFIHDGLKGMDNHRSSQREAALTKFRLKRKDRCFEKKVRYQSRKRLAEQRPRVRGQFVRQVQNDNPIGDGDDLKT